MIFVMILTAFSMLIRLSSRLSIRSAESLTASPYLQVIKSGVLDLFAPVNDTRQAVILVLLFFLVIGWSSWRYYKYLQTVISIGYVILLVLAVLPFVLGAG